MPYVLKVSRNEVFGKGKYKNAQGHTECVEFVRQVTSAPHTTHWKQGRRISTARSGEIAPGTAIATFDSKGHYPMDALGKHAAIYLGHDANGITVLDQWNAQGEVKERSIRFKRPLGTKRSNDADTFYVVE